MKDPIEYRIKMKDPLEELMVITMEECAEVAQACSKIWRFGYDPDKLEKLEREVGDLMCMIDLMHKYDLISFTNVDKYTNEKYEKLKEYSDLI